jgi:hypothetical protein
MTGVRLASILPSDVAIVENIVAVFETTIASGVSVKAIFEPGISALKPRVEPINPVNILQPVDEAGAVILTAVIAFARPDRAVKFAFTF